MVKAYMSKQKSSQDWSTGRGERWCAHLASMEAMLAPVMFPLFNALQVTAPCRIADVGCGGGGTSLALLRSAPPGTSVDGYDISPALVAAARSRLVAADPGRVRFQVADVGSFLPEEPYDRLVSRFGIMFFADEEAAFANLLRWLRKGERFAFAVWGPSDENPWITEVGQQVASLVELDRPDPQGPGPFRYGSPEGLLSFLTKAGADRLEITPWRGELAIGGGLDPDGAARFALSAFSSFAQALDQAGPIVAAQAQQALADHFQTRVRDGVVWSDAAVHILSGVRKR